MRDRARHLSHGLEKVALGWSKRNVQTVQIEAACSRGLGTVHVATILSSLEMAVATSVFLLFLIRMLVRCLFPLLLCEKVSVSKGFCV